MKVLQVVVLKNCWGQIKTCNFTERKNELIKSCVYKPIIAGVPPKSCGNPGTPGNGMRSGDSFLVGAVVQYSCSAGFNLVGSDSVTCQSNGIWSAPLPTCIKSSTPEGKEGTNTTLCFCR